MTDYLIIGGGINGLLLASWAQDFYPSLCTELASATGIDPQWRQCGLLMLQADDVEAALRWAAQQGRAMELVDGRDIWSMEPELAASFTAGLWMPDIANVRNPRLGQALVASLIRDPGVTGQEHCRVTGIQRQGNRVIAVEVSQADLKAVYEFDQVIICAGAWSSELASLVGLCLPVEPVKGQMLL